MLGQVFRVDTKDDERGFLTICLTDLLKSMNQSYTVEGTINANSKSLSFEVYVLQW
jgi:hypothetical protein